MLGSSAEVMLSETFCILLLDDFFFFLNSLWVMVYGCSQTQGIYFSVGIGWMFWMGEELPRCSECNFVDSGRDSSCNVDTRPKHRLGNRPLPFFRVTRASQDNLPTPQAPSSLQALTGFCWSLTWLFKAVGILIARPQVDTAC